MSSALAQRYGTGRTGWGRVFAGALVIVLTALVAWTAWAVWVHSTPKVSSTLTTWTVRSSTRVSVVMTVRLSSDAREAHCDLKAYAEDHTTVGTLRFTPVDGRQTVSLRTYRRATSVDSVGCTASGQQQPR